MLDSVDPREQREPGVCQNAVLVWQDFENIPFDASLASADCKFNRSLLPNV
jgi:hypothetical protein